MKKLFLLLMALLLLAQTSAIQITADYPTNVVVRDFENPVQLTLTITDAEPGTYNLYTLSDVSIKPSQNFEITETPFQKTFTISPNENLKTKGNYAFTYVLNQRDVEKYETKMAIKLVDLEDIIEINSESVNTETGQISFYIKNKASAEVKDVTATFSSILFEETKTFTISPNQKLVIPLNVDKEKLSKISSGVYVITSTFESEDGEKIIEGNLYIGEKKEILSTEDESGILIQTETITRTNTGNVIESVQIKTSRNIFSRLFTSFNLEPAFVHRDGMSVEYTWNKEKLYPTESYIVEAKTNYVFPFLIVVVLILVILGYRRFSETKLEIKKSVTPVKTKGGEFALKVTLAIRARKAVENITLTDRIPKMVKIYNKFGTVEPTKVDVHNRRIQWAIDKLQTGEQRTFTYIVYSKVGIVGKFSLPRAIAVFEKGGDIHEVDSNNVFFMNEQSSID